MPSGSCLQQKESVGPQALHVTSLPQRLPGALSRAFPRAGPITSAFAAPAPSCSFLLSHTGHSGLPLIIFIIIFFAKLLLFLLTSAVGFMSDSATFSCGVCICLGMLASQGHRARSRGWYSGKSSGLLSISPEFDPCLGTCQSYALVFSARHSFSQVNKSIAQ